MHLIDRLSKNIERTIIAIILIVSCFALYITIKDIEKSARQNIGKSLEATLYSFRYSVHLNIEQRTNYLKSLSRDQSLINDIEKLFNTSQYVESILLTDEYKDIKKELTEFVIRNNDVGFYLVSRNKKIFASLNEEKILDSCILFDASYSFVNNVISGKSAFMPPYKHYMYIGTPIANSNDSIIGALILKMHASQIFNPSSQLGQIGYSGKNYVLNKQGRIVSQSRFSNILKAKGIDIGNENGITDIRIGDPQIDIKFLDNSIDYDTLSLTLMAEYATQGINGREINGYNDYRGVKVLGAWSWDKNLNLGFVSEIDEDEALSAFYHTRNTVIIVLGFAVFITSILIFLIGKMRQRNIKNLQFLNNKLEQKVKERTLELEEANKTKDKFLNIISHDLRGQIGSLNELLKLITKSLESYETKDLRFALNTSQKTAENTFNLLSNLLEWSKSQQGQILASKEAIEINNLINETELLYKQQMNLKDIKFQFFYENNIYVWADRNMLKTILRNIVSNAIKFTPNNGEITIVVKESIYENILISIKDTGIGMNKDETDAIFKFNRKFHKEGTNNEPGSGFGLKLCNEFIAKNNGTIWIESTPGEGSTVSFLIPEYKQGG